MATDFSQESVLRFLLHSGGTVKNADLLTHFRRFLREHEDQAQNRELFKKFVNTVATVKQEDGVSYVLLRKKYRVHIGDVTVGTRSDPQNDKKQEGGGGFAKNNIISLEATVQRETESILPAVGIVNNNYIKQLQPEIPAKVLREDRECPVSCRERTEKPLDSMRTGGISQSFQQPFDLHVQDLRSSKARQLQEAEGCSQKLLPPTDNLNSVSATAPQKHASFSHISDSLQNIWPFPISLRPSQVSASTPCLHDIPTFASPSVSPQGGLSQSNESLLRTDLIPGSRINNPQDCGAVQVEIPEPPMPVGYLVDRDLNSLSSRHSVGSSVDSELQLLEQEKWSSEDVLNCQSSSLTEDVSSLEVGLTPGLGKQKPVTWHSTGHLVDEEPRTGSEPAKNMRPRPVARRLSNQLRSRMCRSLGADLDQAFREDADVARLRRLQRVTSFLHVTSVPSSQTHSPMDSLSPASSVHSLGPDVSSYTHRRTHIPMEPQEHEWFVKAAAGNWSEIYSLFRVDPSLLAKRDFVSGYTILHWIAKHGDHRVLNTLWYGVCKAGMSLDVDVRSTCGYTPLHLAAIHGHKNLLRLLVNKFKANVALRDNNGKRPWQYLEKHNDHDILELLGAHKTTSKGSVVARWALDKPPVGPGIKSSTAVKRNSSIAALFKHRPNLRVVSSNIPESFL